MFTQELKKSLLEVLEQLQIEIPADKIILEHPADLSHGDYSTNIALVASRELGKPPRELADKIENAWKKVGLPDFVEKVEVAGLGFLNIWLNFDAFGTSLHSVLAEKDEYGKVELMKGKKIMVEFAHPNTHKELHIGHMRTLITGESLSRIFIANGAKVFRANYQGDVGPHVAKSIWGTLKILEERKISWEEAEKMTLAQKAHLLGEGYVKGVASYEDAKDEIDKLNTKIYSHDQEIWPVYERTRRWSLEYYNSFYERFYTKFDHLFFESDVADEGKKLVLENVRSLPSRLPAGRQGRQVFERSEGAIIFDGEKLGLHTRVFITKDGNPTYEAKDMALAKLQYKTFPFDQNIHVVANEQAGYFKVMIKALETLDPKFINKEFHLPMGMVNMVGKKMSSRTGVIIRVDELLEEVKNLLKPLIREENVSNEEKEKVAETCTVGAVKYSMLKVDPESDVLFDLGKSVSLQGNSGLYLQYTYARTQSVLAKSEIRNSKLETNLKFKIVNISEEEKILLRTLYKFPEVVSVAGKEMFPNLICNFLFDLAQKFNLFYDKERIIGSENEEFRLQLTAAVSQIIKNGLNLLGIEAPEKM